MDRVAGAPVGLFETDPSWELGIVPGGNLSQSTLSFPL